MAEFASDLSNPYASPAPAEEAEALAGPVRLPLTREIWLATALIWTACAALACTAGYVLLGWIDHKNPSLRLGINRADQLAEFAAGASNAIVMAGLFAYGQYHAVIRRDMIWTRTIALLLVIGSFVIALGAALIFTGDFLMWALFVPAAWSAVLSGLMFRWLARLAAFRRQQRKRSALKAH
jgi:hypothetical protein